MSENSSKNKKKPVAGSFIPYETGYVNIAGETFFLSMGDAEPGSFELTDDSIKTDLAFDLLFLGGSSKTFTDAEKATLQRVIRAIFGAGKSMTKKGLRLPCSKEEGELLVRSLLYRRSLLMDEIASYDELLAEDVRARYLRDHLDRLNQLIDEEVPQTIAPCKDTALVDPNKPAKVVGLDDERMLKLLEIFAYLLAQGYDPIEVLGKKLPIPADILTRMAQKNAPLLRDYETEFERERGSGKRPKYTRTLIKIKKVLEDDSEVLAAIAPEEALSAISDIEDKLKINPTHKGTIKERRDGIIGAIDALQKALAAALAEVQRLQAENDQLLIKYYELERELKDTKALLAAAVQEIVYWMSIRDEYEILLRDLPEGSEERNLLEAAIKEIVYWMSIRDEYEALIQELSNQMNALVEEIAFWMNISDEYYVLITDMFIVIDQMEMIITESFNLLDDYGRLVGDYGDALSAVVDENVELREQIAQLIRDKQYILDLLAYIWDSLGAFIERMEGQGLITPGAYPALDRGTLNTLHDSTITLNTFLGAIQMPAPPAAAANTNASILCMLNTLYFIIISQMDPAVEPILLELYGALQPGEIDLIIKVFYKLVFAIRKNLPRVPNPIENWGDTIGTITLRLQGLIQTLFAHEDRVISVFETFIGDPDFFKKDYSDGDKVIKENKHNSTLMTYIFFLAVLAGTLHTDENQRILNEFGCSVAGPPPEPDTFTLTLVSEPVDQGTLTGSGDVDDGTAQQISWDANGTPYTFDHWEPGESVDNPGAAQTNTKPITEDTTITAHLTESPPPPPPTPPPPPVPVTIEQLCAKYKQLFYRFNGEPQREPRFLDEQEAFKAQFTPVEFAFIEKQCHPVEKQYARAQKPEFLGLQGFLKGPTSSNYGSSAPAYIPRPSRQSRGGRRHRSGNVTRKRRTH